MDKEMALSFSLFILFFLYGFSNIYIIVYLRKKEDYNLGLYAFIALFMGDIKNYKKMNEQFVFSFMKYGRNIVPNRVISIIHIASPLLIPVVLVVGVLSIGFF